MGGRGDASCGGGGAQHTHAHTHTQHNTTHNIIPYTVLGVVGPLTVPGEEEPEVEAGRAEEGELVVDHLGPGGSWLAAALGIIHGDCSCEP